MVYCRLDLFIEQLGDDLEAYAKHAKRKTIEATDLKLLLARYGSELHCFHLHFHWPLTHCRQRLVNQSTPALEALLHQHLPMELVEQVLPVAKAGNVLVPPPKGRKRAAQTKSKVMKKAKS